jgi:hypothetical protein
VEPPATNRVRVLGAFGTICVSHLLVAAAIAGWMVSWPDTIDGGPPYHLDLPKGFVVFLMVTMLVVPALGISFAISCGALAALRRLRRRSGLAAGLVASLIGLGAVTAAIAAFALTR